MAQGEQVVGQVHAVVVLDGRQVRELQQVLSEHETETRNRSGRKGLVEGLCGPVLGHKAKASFASRPGSSIVVNYSFCCVLFGILEIPLKLKPDLEPETALFTSGCSLFARF